MMRGIYQPTQNHLLGALPAADLQRLQRHLTPAMLTVGEALYEAGSQIHYVYLPTTAIISLLYVTRNGSSSNVAVVGNEGLIDVSSFMSGETSTSRAVVQSAGHAFRLPGQVLKQEFMRGGTVQTLLLRYTQALLTQMAQMAVCNRHHSVEQQLCRWLLLSLDRLPTNQLRMTQELIANMLGVRREGVTEAAGRLQSAGIIEYRRGHITILNRAALEARACECYSVIKLECDKLLPRLNPPLPQPFTTTIRPPVVKRPLYAAAPMYAEVPLTTAATS